MKIDSEVDHRMYTYAFNCFYDVMQQIQCIQRELECLMLDLEDANEEADPQARREAMIRVERRFQETRKRRQELAVFSAQERKELIPEVILRIDRDLPRTKKELP